MNVRIFTAIGMAALAVGCATAPRHGAGRYDGTASKVAPKHVVVVGWDGFAGNTVEAGMTEDTVVMVTSDHGGLNKGHGGPTLSEMERPVVLWGKDVKRGHELAFPGANYDTGATIAALLGLEPPTCWIGRPFDEAFEAK